MESFWGYVMKDLIGHPVILALVILILVQLQELKKEVRILYRDFCEHLKNHAKGEL